MLLSEVITASFAAHLYNVITVADSRPTWDGVIALLAIFLADLALGVTTSAYWSIYSTFDFKNASDNLENACKKYSSFKLLPGAVLSTIVITFYFAFMSSSVKFEAVSAFFLVSVYLQVLAYIAMFSNFR